MSHMLGARLKVKTELTGQREISVTFSDMTPGQFMALQNALKAWETPVGDQLKKGLNSSFRANPTLQTWKV